MFFSRRKKSREKTAETGCLKFIEVGHKLTQNQQANFIIAYQNELCRKIY
jgi:hypothetical protein